MSLFQRNGNPGGTQLLPQRRGIAMEHGTLDSAELSGFHIGRDIVYKEAGFRG